MLDTTKYDIEYIKPGIGGNSGVDIVTEDSVALVFEEEFGEKLRYCHDTGCWFEWDGSRWKLDKKHRAYTYARELAREQAKGESLKTRIITAKSSFAQGVERYCQRSRVLAVTSDDWDQDPFLLGTPGGTVDLRTGELRKANPGDGITKTARITPAVQVECSLWLKFLDDITGGDKELIRLLQLWFGYALTGSTREQKLALLYGHGGNGKSVLLNTIVYIVGDYAATATMDAFVASKSDKHTTDLAMLRGARLVTASESEKGHFWAESRIKQMTGGDPVTARFMRQNNFTFIPECKITVVSNHKPQLRNVDDAMRRRLIFIPFLWKPPAPDRELESKLRAEAPGILRWMIDGCLDWQKNGLVLPQSVQTATDSYFTDQNTIQSWMDECCEIKPVRPGAPAVEESATKLFNSWKGYCTKVGEEAGSQKSFGESLEKLGIEKRRTSNGIVYRGIYLREQQQTSDASDDLGGPKDAPVF